MRVLYFSRDYSPHDERFLNALSRTAHEIYFLRLEPSNPVKLPNGVNEITFKGSNAYPARAEELKQLLNTVKPDVVHAGPLHGPAYIAALTGYSPLASMSWGADILQDGEQIPLDRVKIQYTLDHSTVLIGDCQAVADKAISQYRFPRECIFLFPWGVDLEHFMPIGEGSLRARLGWQDNFVFLSNRSFEPIYGVDVVLQAFIRAEKQNPALRLLLYGKGSQEKTLHERINESRLADKVYFGGYASRAELPGFYRSADVFVSASHCDGSSVSVMEALACGLPALVSDIPGNMEWVEEGEQGWLFADGDVNALTALMLSVSHEPSLESMGQHARALAEAKADWSRNFPVLLEAYESARQLHFPAEHEKRGTP